ncbi:hypothetical protein F4777DRAFT_575237 [Nemania sp. FL0916]|nr:hypothetical protein F4777DRAFT_575237 [Nemania sp. FL0916]
MDAEKDAQFQGLLASNHSLYVSGQYSDLTITCHGNEYKVHKAIVCPKSGFFAGACRGQMKEALEGIVDLPDDEPEIVDIMVHFFYHLDYLPRSRTEPKKEHAPSVRRERGTSGNPPSYHETATAPPPKSSDLVVHAKVYAIAAKYLIDDLKSLAQNKFTEQVLAKWQPGDEFPEAAKVVYTTTCDRDRGLRDIMTKRLWERRGVLLVEKMQTVLKECHGLSYDLLMYGLVNGPRWSRDW